MFAALLLSGCASKQALPPGNELEAVEHPGGSSLPHSFQRPPADEGALAAAFDPDEAKSKTASAGTANAGAAPANAPTDETPGVASAVPVEASDQAKAAFAGELASTKKLVSSGAVDEARPAVGALTARAAELGPAEQQQAVELAYKLAATSQDWAAARTAADHWLITCGPERADGCRAKALGALSAVGKSKDPAAAGATERVTLVRKTDECVREAEAAARAKAAIPACVDAGAIGTYKRLGDGLMVARLHLAKGLAVSGDPAKFGEMVGQLQRVDRDCAETRCAAVRRRALKTIAYGYLRSGNLEHGTRALLQELKLAASVLQPEKRAFVRTPEVEKTCAQLDKQQGPGTCRKLEKQVNGDYTFFDFSAQHARGGLVAEKVRQVNEHFAVMMQECLAVEAERLVPPASVKYDLRWMVNQAGRVENFEMGRKDQESTPLAVCLRKQFSVWRYPRYEGEAQHIAQSFTLNARERSSMK